MLCPTLPLYILRFLFFNSQYIIYLAFYSFVS